MNNLYRTDSPVVCGEIINKMFSWIGTIVLGFLIASSPIVLFILYYTDLIKTKNEKI